MAVPQFPSEVLENILRFLDAPSFCISRGVCKAWNLIIKSMQKKQCYWKEFCFKEIPSNVLKDYLGFKKDVWKDIDWMSIYRKWYHSRMILTPHYWKKKINSIEKNPVTCVYLSGSWVITGHSNGLVSVWDLLSGELSQSFFGHLKMINDIALVDLLNLGYYYGTQELPWAHHHMITISKDRYINVTLLLEPMVYPDSRTHYNYHTDDLEQIKIFGDIFAVRCRDNTITLWKMSIIRHPHFSMEVKLLRNIVGPEDYLLSVGFWLDEIQCVSNSGKLKVINIHEDEWTEERYFKTSCSESSAEVIIAVTDAFLFHQKTVIMLTSNGKIILSINENCCRHFYLMKTLQTTVVSVALFGSILALGGENGKLFLFYVFSEEELCSLDLSQPDSTISLSEASITSINISHKDDLPVIAASTNDSIHIIRWYRPKESHKRLKRRDISQLFL